MECRVLAEISFERVINYSVVQRCFCQNICGCVITIVQMQKFLYLCRVFSGYRFINMVTLNRNNNVNNN